MTHANSMLLVALVLCAGAAGSAVLTAAKVFGARGLGVEMREDLVASARQAAAQQGIDERVRFVHQDLFETDLSEATVVTIYLRVPWSATRGDRS